MSHNIVLHDVILSMNTLDILLDMALEFQQQVWIEKGKYIK